MISVDITFVANEVVHPDLESVYNSSYLEIVSRISLFMLLQLSGSISNDSPILHQYTSKSLARGITIDDEILSDIRQC